MRLLESIKARLNYFANPRCEYEISFYAQNHKLHMEMRNLPFLGNPGSVVNIPPGIGRRSIYEQYGDNAQIVVSKIHKPICDEKYHYIQTVSCSITQPFWQQLGDKLGVEVK